MTFNDLIAIDIKQEIINLLGEEDNKPLNLFNQLLKLELLPYSHIELLIDDIPSTNAFKSMCISVYITNKANLSIWSNFDAFGNVGQFKKNHTQTDTRNITNTSNSSSNLVFNEGYQGFGQDNNFRIDKTNSNSDNTYTMKDGLNRNLSDDDPELAIRVLKTNIKNSIQENIKAFILKYGRVTI